MNMAIAGTGAMAMFYAYSLKPLSPTLIGRRYRPFLVTESDKQTLLDPPFVSWNDAADTPWDVIILAVKWPAMPLVQQLLARQPNECLVISLMNGMGQEAALIPPLSPQQLACGLTTNAVTLSWNKPHRLPEATVTARGETTIPLMPHPLIPFWKETLDHIGWSWRFLPLEAVLRARWVKLVQNSVINPLSVLANAPNGALPDLPLWHLMPDLIHEARMIAQTAGIVLPSNLGEKVTQLARATAPNISSMLQDVRRHRPTEINAINGYLVQQARAHGMHLPTHEAVIALIDRIASNPNV